MVKVIDFPRRRPHFGGDELMILDRERQHHRLIRTRGTHTQDNCAGEY